MIFVGVIAHLKDKLAKRAEFQRLIKEIDGLSRRDLEDLETSRQDLIGYIRADVYRKRPA